jgi:hypothetical protein
MGLLEYSPVSGFVVVDTPRPLTHLSATETRDGRGLPAIGAQAVDLIATIYAKRVGCYE